MRARGRHGDRERRGDQAGFYRSPVWPLRPDRALYVSDSSAVRRDARDGAVTALTRALDGPEPDDLALIASADFPGARGRRRRHVGSSRVVADLSVPGTGPRDRP